ncbi:SRPBCC domain-containing protein [Arenimonas donghaensis]|uniref:Activator of Hsp90 ATPase homologue 1/2-like C-terminal domain-containing protein n=1 Tax=Arenimonas donghaensis DSM 18148 = HO3-R19 TaxID=1121014 RepID=A0A087MMD8_9GAMM|nr:SRPBCC domain-containing protein [Arenimonas donghaensis]KFL38041.1 hypothetical protein N788_02370 [Arenimonas donghaensis DSM 18148 = HO3-R19]
MARTTLQADLAERQVILTRDFQAPRELVFQAFTDAGALARWWGPHGFNTEIVENQVQAGGRYHFVMRDGEGNAYPVRGQYVEVTPPGRLVMTDDCSCMPPEWLREHAADEMARGEAIVNTSVTTFEDLGDGRTRMRMEITCPNNRLRDGLVKAGMNEGWGESFEKLDAALRTP